MASDLSEVVSDHGSHDSPGSHVSPAGDGGDGFEDDRRAIARGGMLGMTGSLYAAVAGFALTVVVGQLYGVRASGIYFMAVSVYMILNGVAMVGSDTGMVRTLATHGALGNHARQWSAVRVVGVAVTGWSTVIAVTLFAVARPLAQRLAPDDVDRAALYFEVLAVSLVLSGIGQACLSGSRSLGTLRPFVLLYQVFLPTARVLGAVLLAVSSGTADGLMWTWAVPLLLMDLYAVAHVVRLTRRAARIDPGPVDPPWRQVFREEWSFNLPRGLAQVFELGLVWSDVLIVGLLLGPATAGAWAAASRFMTSGMMAMDAVTLGTAPMFAASFARGQRERVASIYSMASVWLVLLSWPVMLTMAAFAPYITSLIGDGFGIASTAMTVMSLSVLVYLALGNIHVVVLMAGKSATSSIIMGGCLALNIALNFLLVPHLGLVGAAIGWSLALTVESLACLVVGHRLLGELNSALPALSLSCGVTLVAWGVPGLVARLVGEQSLVWLAAYVVVSGVLFLAGLALFRRRLQLDDFTAMIVRRRGARTARAPGAHRAQGAQGAV